MTVEDEIRALQQAIARKPTKAATEPSPQELAAREAFNRHKNALIPIYTSLDAIATRLQLKMKLEQVNEAVLGNRGRIFELPETPINYHETYLQNEGSSYRDSLSHGHKSTGPLLVHHRDCFGWSKSVILIWEGLDNEISSAMRRMRRYSIFNNLVAIPITVLNTGSFSKISESDKELEPTPTNHKPQVSVYVGNHYDFRNGFGTYHREVEEFTKSHDQDGQINRSIARVFLTPQELDPALSSQIGKVISSDDSEKLKLWELLM